MLTIFIKPSILDVWQGSEYDADIAWVHDPDFVIWNVQ